MALSGERPAWLTFDCYGTLIQWDEGLIAAVETILSEQSEAAVEPETLIAVYDKHEHALEQMPPHRAFKEVAGLALKRAMEELGLSSSSSDLKTLTSSISKMPPFPEVVGTLGKLKEAGFKLCIISNTDDDIIQGNVDQLGGHIDRVITAEQAQAYKPRREIFDHAHRTLGVTKDEIVHICASPHLDLQAARDMGFRCVWINRSTGRKALADYTSDAEFATLAGVIGGFSKLGWV